MTLVLAHRGSRLREPENTVSAFARAMSEGADGVELDVHRTADGELVVCHDAASPAGVVSDMTLAEVQRAFPLVPTLAAALDACAGGLVNVEIKNLPGDAFRCHRPGRRTGRRIVGLQEGERQRAK
ncbi:MAG: glycerophosphodiester phosphodiesterase family protein [Acidimicrobiia bacterium]